MVDSPTTLTVVKSPNILHSVYFSDTYARFRLDDVAFVLVVTKLFCLWYIMCRLCASCCNDATFDEELVVLTPILKRTTDCH